MHYEKLYKRTVTGAIQVWWLELDEGDIDTLGGRYRTHSGQDGGKIVTSEWTRAKPKNVGRGNETTALQQAHLEIDAHYSKKKKAYSVTLETAHDLVRFTPMLAKSFEDYVGRVTFCFENKLPVWAQPKLDGIRCVATKDGLFTRTGERIVSCPHIEEMLRPIFELFPDLVIDGELYNHQFKEDFNEIVSMVKKVKPSAAHLLKTAELVQYHIYDTVCPGDISARLRYTEYYVGLAGAVFGGPGAIQIVRTDAVPTRGRLDALYSAWLDEGYEGQMVRLAGEYEQKRSSILLKRKEFTDSEFEILEILEGEGNSSGGARIAWLKLDTDPTKKFKADIVGTYAERQEVWVNPNQWIGKMATVKYFKQRTPAGIPRFAKLKTAHMKERW